MISKFRILFILLIVIVYNHGYSQESKISLTGQLSYLPSSNCSIESYKQKGSRAKHVYKRRVENCYRHPKLGLYRTNGTNLQAVVEFVNKAQSSRIWKIPIDSLVKDSALYKEFVNSSLYENDSIIIDFETYAYRFYHPQSDDSILLPPFEPIQIDGEWLSIELISNTDTLIDVSFSYTGLPRVDEYHDWFTLYLIYHNFDLFEKLSIQHYFKRENLIDMLYRYINVMEKSVR